MRGKGFVPSASSHRPARVTWTTSPSPASLVRRTLAHPKRLAWRHVRQRAVRRRGDFGTVLTSPDAVTWTSRLPERDGILEDVAYGNGRFVAVGGQYDWDSTTVLTFTEGTVWTDGAPVNGFHLLRLVFANGLFIGIGGDPAVIVTSPDGITWTERWHGTEEEDFGGWRSQSRVMAGC